MRADAGTSTGPRTRARRALACGFALLVAGSALTARAEEPPADGGGPVASTAADANNPLAKTQAFNLHDYYIPTMSEAPDQTANTFWLRYAQPFGKWLVRASLPLSRVPAGDGTTKSGLGDFNAFAAYLFDTKPGVSFGVGPQVTVPTATADETGTGKWQGGLAAVYFNATSPSVQWGGLVTWQADFAGDADRSDTNVLAVQPFYFVQLGKGLYARSTAIMAFNLEDGSYNVPAGLGIGKVIPTKSVVFNVFVEPQFTVLSHGARQPELQVFVGFNTQFLKK
ncbi:MAG: hypothetical protein IPL90_03600 [Holophagales bacterium]|nr:hypothetical protein [Holophagales bacterium]